MTTSPRRPFRVRSVVTCEEVRREDNGKDILLGVYSGLIVMPRVPAVLQRFAIRFECVGHPDVVQGAVEVTVTAPDKKNVASSSGRLEFNAPDAEGRPHAPEDMLFAFSVSWDRCRLASEGVYPIHLTVAGHRVRAGDFRVVVQAPAGGDVGA